MTSPPTSPVSRKPLRYFAGVLIPGERIELELVPNIDGFLSISVRGLAAATGFRETCMLGDPEARRYFSRGDVEVDDDMLRCMTPCPSLPHDLRYREGFSVALDPGQADVLRAELPRLERTAILAMALAERLRELLPKPIEHKLEFAANIAARVVLDATPPADALRLEAALHWAGKDSPFCAAFGDACIAQLLVDAYKKG